MSYFSEHLKELRLEKGLAQQQLANEIGFSRAAVGLWEKDKREPALSALIAIADYFDLSLDDLVGRNPNNKM